MAVHTMDSADHTGGWSVNASMSALLKPKIDGKIDLVIAPLEILDRLSKLISPRKGLPSGSLMLGHAVGEDL